MSILTSSGLGSRSREDVSRILKRTYLLGPLRGGREELLTEVRQRFDEVLPPMAGLSPSANRAALVSETENVVKGLVDLAAPPATDLARGFVTVAIRRSRRAPFGRYARRGGDGTRAERREAG